MRKNKHKTQTTMHEIFWWFLLIGVLITAFSLATLAFPLHEADAYGNGMCQKTCQAKIKARAEAILNSNTTIIEQNKTNTQTDIESTSEFINQAKEKTNNKATYISVILSEVCKVSTKCPSMKYLADAYDNSNRYLSGDFINSTGEWKRTEPKYTNVFELYRQSNNYLMIFVDPDDYTRTRTKNIYIEPEIYDYFNRGDGDIKMKSVTSPNGTKVFERVVRQDFQISDGCNTARMGWAGNGEKLFANLVAYFYSGCTRDIGQNNTKIETKKATEFTDCGPSCQYQNWLKNATEQSKKGFLINPNKTISTNEVK